MSTSELQEIFEKHHDEYLKFDRVENKLSTRHDLHAFIMLDRMFPGSQGSMIAHAEHDEFWVDVNLDDLAKAGITEEQVIELVRCGIRTDGETLAMFA